MSRYEPRIPLDLIILTREEAEAAGQRALARLAEGKTASEIVVYGPGHQKYDPPTDDDN